MLTRFADPAARLRGRWGTRLLQANRSYYDYLLLADGRLSRPPTIRDAEPIHDLSRADTYGEKVLRAMGRSLRFPEHIDAFTTRLRAEAS
jgi:hypothetical protein